MSALYWREPAWLLLALLPLLWLAWQRLAARRARAGYADHHLQPWAMADGHLPGHRWRQGCVGLSLALLAVAAAGPRTPANPEALPMDADQDLVVVLDLSRSMAGTDVWPHRRGVAVRALVQTLPALVGSRVGVVVVGGHAHVLLPPTSDRTLVADLLNRLPALRLPSHGSVLDDGVREAQTLLASSSNRPHLLLVTDGDITPARQQSLRQQLAAQPYVEIAIAGVGTTGGSALPDEDGNWLVRNGEPVISGLAEAALTKLASEVNGRYATLDPAHPADTLRELLPATLAHRALPADADIRWNEPVGWLLAPALALLLAGTLALPRTVPAVGLITALAYLAGLLFSVGVRADLAAAHAALDAGDLAGAHARFNQLGGYAGRMGNGYVCHRLDDSGCATQAFAKAVLLAHDDEQRAAAIYNLGHARFLAGDYLAAADLFEDALGYAPHMDAARHNRDYARALAAEVARLAGGPQSEQRRRGRAGTADNSAPANDEPFALSDSTTRPALPEANDDDTQALINRGLEHIALADRRGGGTPDAWASAFGSGAQAMDDITLWQRLLEQDEGLPASPAIPRVRDGVRPW